MGEFNKIDLEAFIKCENFIFKIFKYFGIILFFCLCPMHTAEDGEDPVEMDE